MYWSIEPESNRHKLVLQTSALSILPPMRYKLVGDEGFEPPKPLRPKRSALTRLS
jgi:hypothetical protein